MEPSVCEQLEEAFSAERMAWAALQVTTLTLPERIVLQALWYRYADEISELSTRMRLES